MSDTTQLYMIVERGKESGAYEGLGSLADYVVDGTLQMSISLGEDVSFLFLFFSEKSNFSYLYYNLKIRPNALVGTAHRFFVFTKYKF